MRVTVVAPNVYTEFGISAPIGSTITVGDDYGASLVWSLKAIDTDGVLSEPGNRPFDQVPPQFPVSGGGYGRPRILVYGNSIASQSSNYITTTLTTAAADIKAGATSLLVSSAQTLADGAKIAVSSYYGDPEFLVVAGAVSASTTIPLRSPTTRMIRASAGWTTYATDQPTNIRQGYGIVSCALAMLGDPAEIIAPSYGYGGATLYQMLVDLPTMLWRARPDFVAAHLLENDIVGDRTWAQTKPLLQRFCELCLSYGATPIIFSSVPSVNFNNGGRSAHFDAQSEYINGGGLRADFPVAHTVDISSPWLDTGWLATGRRPITGIASDGIHPDGAKRYYCGSFALPKFSELFGGGVSRGASALNANPTMVGTAGTRGGGGSNTGPVADSWALTSDAGLVVTLSKNDDGSQKIVTAVPGASNISTSTVQLTSEAITVQNNWGPAGPVRGFVKLRINSQSNYSLFYPEILMSSGEIYAGGQDSTLWPTDSTVVGRELTICTAPIRIPANATTMQIRLRFRPQTLSSPSGVAADVDVLEMGIEPGLLV